MKQLKIEHLRHLNLKDSRSTNILKRLGLFIGLFRYWYFYTLVLRRQPVLIYTPGSSGTASISWSLRKCNVFTIHLHKLSYYKDKTLLDVLCSRLSHGSNLRHVFAFMFYRCMLKGKPVKIITGVRNPVDKNFSQLFQKYYTHFKDKPLPEVYDFFIESFEHDDVDVWFNKEFVEMFGIDIEQNPFPERGWLHIVKDNVHILVFKFEIPDNIIESNIKYFLGLSEFKMGRHGVTKSIMYEDFKKYYVYPDSFKDMIYGFDYSKYFNYRGKKDVSC